MKLSYCRINCKSFKQSSDRQISRHWSAYCSASFCSLCWPFRASYNKGYESVSSIARLKAIKNMPSVAHPVSLRQNLSQKVDTAMLPSAEIRSLELRKSVVTSPAPDVVLNRVPTESTQDITSGPAKARLMPREIQCIISSVDAFILSF